MSSGSITDIAGVLVGHDTDMAGVTGCTVVLCPPGTVGSGEVRGGAPGTRETDLLRPGTLVQEINAVLLTGGSAFGLAAADGVMRFLAERGSGFDAGVATVPIVPAAVLFDLDIGDASARPGPESGYRACLAALGDVAEGTVGAGTGATVAKLEGPGRALKGGIGTASVREGDVVVGALAAVNALGEILNEDGTVLAGVRPETDGPAASPERGSGGDWPAKPPGPPQGPTNTTLVVVATNARLSKERAHLLSLAGHEGLAATVRPAHTMWDGDTVFALATGQADADQRSVEALATRSVGEAIRRSVLQATGIGGFPSIQELQ
jgi:L-aminopeptidase/D-esterase-like protein